MKLKDIDRKLFTKIKAAKVSGTMVYDAADEFDLTEADTQVVYESVDYDSFRKELLQATATQDNTLGEQPVVPTGKQRQHTINTLDYLLAKKHGEFDDMTKTRDFLVDHVRFLRKAVKMLELRKKELEDGIALVERQLVFGISMVEDLQKIDESQSA